jgi:CMP-N-acetylneuraminic acid synthetase
MCLQATSPLVSPVDIRNAVRMFKKPGARSVVSVTPAPGHPEWYFRIGPGGRMLPLIEDTASRRKRSQDLPAYYTLNGAVSIRRSADVLAGKIVYDRAIVLPPERGLDIDGPEDLETAAEFLAAK